MSKQYLLKISGLAAMTLLLFSPTFAQDQEQKESKDTLKNKDRDYEEIIVRPKKDKDVKVTVEVKDGQVLVNGKPVAEFDDNNVTIIKKKIRVWDGDVSSFSGPGEMEEFGDHMTLDSPIAPDIAFAPSSPFRKHSGTMSYGGNANRAFLGVTSRPERDGAGAKITGISKGSAAEKAGLREGDIITKVDEIRIGDPDDLSDAVHKYKPTDKVTVTYKRDGKEAKITAILGKSLNVNKVYNYNYDYAIPKMKEYQFKQMAPMQFSWDSKPRLGIKAQDTEDGKGVKVLEVGEESAAEKSGIKEGDIITSFDGKEVNSAITLSDLAKDAKDKPSIKVGLIRDGKAQVIEVKIPKKLKTANL